MNSELKVTRPVSTILNSALYAAGLPQRLVRGRGYYYVTDAVFSESLYQMWLERNERDLHTAFDTVVAALANEGVDAVKVQTFIADFKRRVERMQS